MFFNYKSTIDKRLTETGEFLMGLKIFKPIGR